MRNYRRQIHNKYIMFDIIYKCVGGIKFLCTDSRTPCPTVHNLEEIMMSKETIGFDSDTYWADVAGVIVG